MNKEGHSVAMELNKFLMNFSPYVICSDNGGEFKDDELKELFDKQLILQNFSKPYTPRTNGCVERLVRDFAQYAFKITLDKKT